MVILADSGILVRFLHKSDSQHLVVKNSVDTLHKRGELICMAPQNIAEFWNVSTRPVTARGGLGLSLVETERRLSDLETQLSILDDHPAAYAIWRALVLKYGVSGKQVHDARLVALMLAQGVTHILTLNVADFTRYAEITVVDPHLV